MPEKPAKPDFALCFGRRNSFYLLDLFWFGLVALSAIKHRRLYKTGKDTTTGHHPQPLLSTQTRPFRQVMWRGDRTADWPIRGSLWWGDRAPGDRARIVLSDSVVGGPGESALRSGSWLLQYTAHLCHGENVTCPPQAHVFACLLPAGDAAWEGCEFFKRHSLPRRNGSPKMNTDSPALLPSYVLLPDWECSVTRYLLLLIPRLPHRDRLCLRTVCKNKTFPPQVASCEISGQKN